MAYNEAYRLYDPSTDQHLLPSFAKIHADCIKHDGQALVLLPPLKDEKVLSYWREQHATLSSGKMIMILAFEPSASSGAASEEIAGFVCLGMPATETGPFRGEVTKLMVSIHHRRKGIARGLMDRLEVEAKKRGRTLLVSHVFPSSCDRVA